QRWTSTDIRVDGAQAKNMLRSGEFGAGPFTLSMEAIREFEVTSAVYDVTQGRQGGGAVRAATKAGTNEWSGSAFTYYRGSGLTATQDFQSRSRQQRQFSAVQWGGSLGGPIVRDRMHFFVAFDRWDSNEPLFSGLIQTPADELSTGVAKDSLTRLTRILATTYALDTTRAQVGRLDRKPVANTAFARLDWSLSDRHRLTLTNDYSGWDSPLSGGVDLPISLFDARSNYKTSANFSLASLHSTFASGVQNELKAGVSTSSRKLTPNSTAPRGFVRIQSTLANGSRGDQRVQFGGNRLAPDDSRELELQLIDHAYIQRGDVLWTLGTDNTLTRMTTYIAEAQSGLFEFNSLADLEAKRAFRYTRTLPLKEAQPTTRQSVLELGAFTQAEWRPSPRITAMLGVRWDGTTFLTKPARNQLVEQILGEETDRSPTDWTKIQPRAQVVWDITGTGRDVLRVGAGRFAKQAP
ncbi:MAG TPA: TonB-dependent receptor, partial [Gemmatimonadaceae bacterium]